MALRDVTPSVIEDVRVELHAAGVGDPTIIKALGFLQGVFKRAPWCAGRSAPIRFGKSTSRARRASVARCHSRQKRSKPCG